MEAVNSKQTHHTHSLPPKMGTPEKFMKTCKRRWNGTFQLGKGEVEGDL